MLRRDGEIYPVIKAENPALKLLNEAVESKYSAVLQGQSQHV
jgi:hypothetical protein